MVRCAVFGCNSNNKKTAKRPEIILENNATISYFHFPTKNIPLSNKWAELCVRKDKFNRKNSSICSLHFKVTDYAQRYDLVLDKSSECSKKRLKDEAYPSLNLPSSKTQENKPLSIGNKRFVKKNFENSSIADHSINPASVEVQMDLHNQVPNTTIIPEPEAFARTSSVGNEPMDHSPDEIPKVDIPNNTGLVNKMLPDATTKAEVMALQKKILEQPGND